MNACAYFPEATSSVSGTASRPDIKKACLLNRKQTPFLLFAFRVLECHNHEQEKAYQQRSSAHDIKDHRKRRWKIKRVQIIKPHPGRQSERPDDGGPYVKGCQSGRLRHFIGAVIG